MEFMVLHNHILRQMKGNLSIIVIFYDKNDRKDSLLAKYFFKIRLVAFVVSIVAPFLVVLRRTIPGVGNPLFIQMGIVKS